MKWDKKDIEKEMGKSLVVENVFHQTEPFSAYKAAVAWLSAPGAGLGFSIGKMHSEYPTGIKHGYFMIDKWTSLSQEDKSLLDGVIVGDFRDGPVAVLMLGGEQ